MKEEVIYQVLACKADTQKHSIENKGVLSYSTMFAAEHCLAETASAHWREPDRQFEILYMGDCGFVSPYEMGYKATEYGEFENAYQTLIFIRDQNIRQIKVYNRDENWEHIVSHFDIREEKLLTTQSKVYFLPY